MSADRLARLEELLNQLRLRDLYAEMCELLDRESVVYQPGWVRMKRAIEGLRETPPRYREFADRFESFIREASLATGKRVYVLAYKGLDPTDLFPPLPAEYARTYLEPEAPERGDEGGDAYFFEERSEGDRIRIVTYVAKRSMRKSENIEPSELRPDARKKYKGAKIVARYDVPLRCYDHIVTIGSQTLLLIDAPEGIDRKQLMRDEYAYTIRIRERLELGESDPLFVDLFPAVSSIWSDDAEGIVNSLEFVSNRLAQIRGRFSITSDENYREQEFQRAGGREAQVIPFRIAVKWPRARMVELPGRMNMISQATLAESGMAVAAGGEEDAATTPLNFMYLPMYTDLVSLRFVLSRVLNHLGG
jgi:hypothetical protein